MKTYLLTLNLVGLLSVASFAQDNPTVRRDVTYSMHNYKHPNKAAAARRWSEKEGVSVIAPGAIAGPIANYKQSMSGHRPNVGISAPHTPEMDVAVRNYKIQRVSEAQPVSQEVAMKVAKDKNPSTTNGDE